MNLPHERASIQQSEYERKIIIIILNATINIAFARYCKKIKKA